MKVKIFPLRVYILKINYGCFIKKKKYNQWISRYLSSIGF